MSRIQPFKAIRFNTSQNRDLSAFLAPPYDVIDSSLREQLLARDQHNIVQIDLPHMPPKTLGQSEAYARSAELLQQWLNQNILIQDAEPALYYYQQTFSAAATTHTRSAFFARVRLEPLSSGSIMPHEQTFSGPKEDRLALTKATRCNLSSVFGLYPDENNEVLAALKPQSTDPDCFADLDSIRNELWIIREPAKVARAAELMAQKKIYIADGHHRYGTSLNYLKFLQESGQSIDDEHPANFISMALVSAADSGLIILPTHRFLSALPANFSAKLRSAISRKFDFCETHLPAADSAQFDAAISAKGPGSIGLYDFAGDQLFVLLPRAKDILSDSAPHISPALRSLSVVILHEYLLSEKLISQIAPACQPEIAYVKDAAKALASAKPGQYQAAFLLQPTTMEELLSVVQAGQLMPQKSTFFYPKIPTGLVINPLH